MCDVVFYFVVVFFAATGFGEMNINIFVWRGDVVENVEKDVPVPKKV